MTRLLPLALAFTAGSVAAYLLSPRAHDPRRAARAMPSRPGDDDADADAQAYGDTPTTQRPGIATETDDDRRLVAAVRAALDRDDLGSSVDIQAEEGRIVATGQIADAQHGAVLQAIRATPGVREVHDHLQSPERGAKAGAAPRRESALPQRKMDS